MKFSSIEMKSRHTTTRVVYVIGYTKVYPNLEDNTLPGFRYISTVPTVGWVHFCVPKTVGMHTFFYGRLHKMSVLKFGMLKFPVLGTQKCTLPISTYVTSTGYN